MNTVIPIPFNTDSTQKKTKRRKESLQLPANTPALQSQHGKGTNRFMFRRILYCFFAG